MRNMMLIFVGNLFEKVSWISWYEQTLMSKISWAEFHEQKTSSKLICRYQITHGKEMMTSQWLVEQDMTKDKIGVDWVCHIPQIAKKNYVLGDIMF